MSDTPTVKLKKAVQHESTSLITRAAIGLGVAYMCWASGQLVANFQEATKTNTAILSAVVKQTERLTTAVEGNQEQLKNITTVQQAIRDKVIRLEVIAEDIHN